MISKQMTFAFEPDVSLDSNIILRGDPRWESALQKWKATPAFGLDMEMYGKGFNDGLNPWKNYTRLIQIGLLDGTAIVADFGGWDVSVEEGLKRNEDFLEVLRHTIPNPRQIKIGQNLLFEYMQLRVKYGLDMRNIRDTMLMSRIYWAGVEAISKNKWRHDLGSIARRFGLEADKGLQKSDWGWELTNAQINYAANDALVVMEIVKQFKPLLIEADLWDIALRECRATRAFGHMQYYGMPVDERKLDEVLQQYEEARKEAIAPFLEEFPHINPGSSDQILKAVNAKYNLGLTSTDQEALASIDMPWANALSFWRSLGKSVDYLSLYDEKKHKASGIKQLMREGFVRSNYHQIAPKGHGRTSSQSPNLQNAPNPSPEMLKMGLPSVRVVFAAPQGYKMIVADLSQAHARIATQVSQDKNLLDSYNHGYDIHAITASALAKLRGYDETWTHQNIKKWKGDKNHPNHIDASNLRQIAKPVFYGSLNGQGAQRLKDESSKDGVQMTLQDAQQAVQAWRDAYSGLYKFQQDVNTKGNRENAVFLDKNYGIVRGLSGRRLFLEKYPNHYGAPAIKYTDAIAFVWMSTEADVMKEALARLVDSIDEHPEWDVKLGNLGHDEIDLICKEEYAEVVDKEVTRIMDECMRIWITDIPVNEKAPCGICNNWAEGK